MTFGSIAPFDPRSYYIETGRTWQPWGPDYKWTWEYHPTLLDRIRRAFHIYWN